MNKQHPIMLNGMFFDAKMTEISQTHYRQMEEPGKLDKVIRKNLEGPAYGA